jgi:hypothetical protein
MAKSLFYELMTLGIGIQLACYLVWSFNMFGSRVVYPLGSASDLTNLNNLFSIDLWSGLIGLAGIGISIVTLLLKQNTYAIYAMLLFAFGIFFNIVKTFLFAIPNTVTAIFASANVPAGATTPLQVVIGVIVVFAGFIYLFELAIQRRAN